MARTIKKKVVKASRKTVKAPKSARAVAAASFTPLDSATAAQLRNVGSKMDLEELSIGGSSLYLTRSEVADVEAFKLRFKSYQVESEKRKLARAFRILDLPPEIRVRIYELVFEERGHDSDGSTPLLANVVAPAIARVCGTFRKECLPLFFAATEFQIPVGTNLVLRATHRTDSYLRDLPDPQREERTTKCSGVLNFKRACKQAIRYAGADAVFKSIKFHVYEADRDLKHRLYFVCGILFRRGQLHVNVTEGPAHPASKQAFIWHSLGLTPVSPQDIDVMVEEIRRIAAEIEAEENCKGLKLKDIERMAKIFRFKEPTKESVTNVEESQDQDEDDDSV